MRNKKFYRKLFVIYAIMVLLYSVIVTGLFFYKNNEIVDLQLIIEIYALLSKQGMNLIQKL